MPALKKLPTSAPGLVTTVAILIFSILPGCSGRPTETADTVYHSGKVLTVDSAFSVAAAVAVKDGRILAVGADREVLALAGPSTEKVDLGGRTVLPGLIEAHAHPVMASTSELEDEIPDARSLGELLDWISRKAAALPDGEWIIHPKMFFTRLAELRAPTLAELDSVAPDNPVFLDGSFGGSINSAAMRASGITGSTRHEGLLRDKETGRLNGLLRFTAFALVKTPPEREYSRDELDHALADMLDRYIRVGFTSVTDGGLNHDQTDIYDRVRAKGRLNIRVYNNIYFNFPVRGRSPEEIRADAVSLGPSTGDGDEWITTGRLKVYLDGGILTGTAYLREPWGNRAGEIFGISDPAYRGILNLNADEFASLARAGAETGWSMTAHATGGGTVDVMLEAYEQVNRSIDITDQRFSIIHGNFFDPAAIERCRALGVVADAQPAWFFKDADAMRTILGENRIRDFHPYRSLIEAGVTVSAGSDHMVKFDDRSSINPFSPWLGMWVMVTRRTDHGSVINPEEAIGREDALRCYTINNAFATFSEDDKGSIEPGKLADFIVIDRDFLACPEDEIKDIRVLRTVVGGRTVLLEENNR